MKKLSMVLVLIVALCMAFAACSAPAAAPAPAEPAAPVEETAAPAEPAAPAEETAPEVQTAPGPVTGENGLVVFVTKAYYDDDENITIEGMMKDVKWVDGEGDETGYYDITDAGETKLIVAPDAKIMFPDEDEVMAYEVAAELFVQQFTERDYMTDGILFSLILTDGAVTSMDFLYME